MTKTEKNKGIIQAAVFLMALLFFTEGHSQFYNKEVVAKIKVDRNSEFFTFAGTAENLMPSDFSLRYELMAFKKDINNNTEKITQGDRFVLKGNEKKILSGISINNNVEGKITMVMVIYNIEDKPIGQDRIVLEFNGKQLEIVGEEKPREPITIARDQAAPQDGFDLNGLVIENTITKAGRDFYKYFYSEYYNMQIKTSKNIVIEEVPGRSRNTRITVEVDDILVWQFFAQPRKEFLKEMASTALDRSIRKLQQLEKQKDQLIRY